MSIRMYMNKEQVQDMDEFYGKSAMPTWVQISK